MTKAALKQVLPWTIAAIAIIAFGISFSELQRVRTRIGQVTRHAFHDHQDVRQFMIRATLAEATTPIVMVGDSITEMARLPDQLCGHTVVNAGIGGATAFDFSFLAPKLLENQHPALIVVALGANDAGQIQSEYVNLFSVLKRYAKTIVVPVTTVSETREQIKTAAKASEVPYFEIPIPSEDDLIDGIHFKGAGYAKWLPAVNAAIASSIRCDRR